MVVKRYVLEFIQHEDGTFKIESTADGYNGLEIVGLLSMKLNDMFMQAKGTVPLPTIINRKRVRESEGE
jgi:hypothetical protein